MVGTAGKTTTIGLAADVRRPRRVGPRLVADLSLALAALLCGVSATVAGGLGLPIDTFLTRWQAWVIGLGIVMFITGLAGWAGEKFNTPYQPMLAGSMTLFTNAGLLGGGLVLAGLVGLVAGGTLPQ